MIPVKIMCINSMLGEQNIASYFYLYNFCPL